MPFGRAANTAIQLSSKVSAGGYTKDEYIKDVMRQYGILKAQKQEQSEAQVLDGGTGKFTQALKDHYDAVKANIGATFDIFNGQYSALVDTGTPYDQALDSAFNVVDEAIKAAVRRAEIKQPKTLVTNKMKSSIVTI